MALTLLRKDSYEFPPSDLALDEPNGLLAVGGDLSCQRLVEAYRRGVFPWFEDGQPILWWSPCPRTILYPERVHCSSSMHKWLKRTSWKVVVDRDFATVVDHCAGTRAKATGTWITTPMKEAYSSLHDSGIAHSVEVYDGQTLVGGLYGVALGGIFYGESMFSHATNASKMALIVLARFLAQRGFELIDCQVASGHLFTLGAEEIMRSKFEDILRANLTPKAHERCQLTWLSAANKVISVNGHILD